MIYNCYNYNCYKIVINYKYYNDYEEVRLNKM